jgi:L-threonylcarbamoyladenylate synthase
MLPHDWTIHHRHVKIFPWNSFDDNTALAHSLFSGLRDLDSRGVTVILCPLPTNNGLGLAIRDRLEKAAKSK